jgi:hypothetical protein
VRSYNPAALVTDARIAENYRFALQGRFEEDEAMACTTCGFRSQLPGTPVFAWRRVREDVEPATVELCELCNAAAAGVRAPQPLLRSEIFG